MTMAKKTAQANVPPPPGPDATAEELVAYFEKYKLSELEAAGYVHDLTPQELKELEEIATGCRKNMAARKRERRR